MYNYNLSDSYSQFENQLEKQNKKNKINKNNLKTINNKNKIR